MTEQELEQAKQRWQSLWSHSAYKDVQALWELAYETVELREKYRDVRQVSMQSAFRNGRRLANREKIIALQALVIIGLFVLCIFTHC